MIAAFEMFLLLFGAVGFAGTGIGLAVARSRHDTDGDTDSGMLGVAGILFVFGAVCTMIGTGVAGVLALGSVITWTAYVVSAQRIGLFEIETGSLEASVAGKPRQRT